MRKNLPLKVLALASLSVILSGCGEKEVSFQAKIKPVIDKNCLECHGTETGEGAQVTGFRTDTYEHLMKGTKYGPVIIPGNPESSSLYRLVAGKVDASITMPHGKEAIPKEDINNIERWIQQGAKNN